MPNLEAPTGLGESSADNSLSSEFAAVVEAAPPPLAPAAMVQIHVQTPETRENAENNARRLLPRIHSYDRDIPALEEDNHWPPAAVHLLPVSLPPQVAERSLDEILRRVTDSNDLQNIETVRLRVISYQVSLSRLGLFLPRLQQLNLSGSVLSSLRDLGFGLVHLSHLNVSNCGLNSFDGTSGLPSVRVLISDSNMIQRVGPLSELPLLQHLSAQHNCINDLGLLTFLGLCPNLTELELQGNPVCYQQLYRVTLQRSVRSLEMLDGISLNAVEMDTATAVNATLTIQRNNSSTDGEVSSLSSELNSETSNVGEIAEQQLDTAAIESASCRPATAPIDSNRNSASSFVQTHRPTSVSNSIRRNSLSMGAPIVGSVLSLVRRNRQQRQRRTEAWITSSSSASSSSDGSTRPPSSVSSSGSFDLKLPPLHDR